MAVHRGGCDRSSGSINQVLNKNPIAMSNEIQITQKDTKISGAIPGFSPEQVAIIKNTVAKGVTDTELAYFLMLAQSVHLNPFKKEIWCYKDNKGNVIIFA